MLTRLRLTAMLILIVGTTSHATAEEPRPLTKDAWAEDLRYLARELPKRHPQPFRAHDEASFQEAVRHLASSLDELEDHQIQVELARLVAMIGAGDGHTELSLPREGRGFHHLPVALAFFEDELRVYAATKGHDELIGARLLGVGSSTAGEAYRRVQSLISHDNEFEFRLTAPGYLVIPEVLHALDLSEDPRRVKLAFETEDGQRVTRTLDGSTREELRSSDWKRARPEDAVPLYREHPGELYWYEWLEGERTVYVSYRRCQNQKGRPSVKRFARDLFAFIDKHPVERLVLDMRNNRGGNYHRSEPLIQGIGQRKQLTRPGGLFVILGNESFSAAVVTAIRLKREAGALLAGSPARGRPNGSDNYERMLLPKSGIRVDYSDRFKDHWPEMGDTAVIPVDLTVENTFEDYRSGQDRVLDAVLAHGR